MNRRVVSSARFISRALLQACLLHGTYSHSLDDYIRTLLTCYVCMVIMTGVYGRYHQEISRTLMHNTSSVVVLLVMMYHTECHSDLLRCVPRLAKTWGDQPWNISLATYARIYILHIFVNKIQQDTAHDAIKRYTQRSQWWITVLLWIVYMYHDIMAVWWVFMGLVLVMMTQVTPHCVLSRIFAFFGHTILLGISTVYALQTRSMYTTSLLCVYPCLLLNYFRANTPVKALLHTNRSCCIMRCCWCSCPTTLGLGRYS